VRGDETVLGMKRFSLHHPAARNDLAEWIYHRALAREGLVALRYEFVEVSLNGKSLGVYALEEHFDKLLLEHNRRREGPILRFDEELMWRQLHEQINPFEGAAWSGYGDFPASAVDGFRTARTLEDPAHREQFLQSLAALEGFRHGRLAPGAVFDLERFATYYALVDLLGAEHGARWHNQRFYWNPLTRRLEPIGFDAACRPTAFLSAVGPAGRHARGVLRMERSFDEALFADPDFEARYLAELERVSEAAYLERLLADLRPDLERALRVLHREFPQVEVPHALLERNRRYLSALLRPAAAVRAYPADGAQGGASALRVGNLQVLPLEVLGLVHGAASADLAAPALLPPRRPGDFVSYQEIALPAAVPLGAGAELRYRVRGTSRVLSAPVAAHSLPEAEALLPSRAERAFDPADFPFLAAGRDGTTLELRPGTWRVASDLVVPAGRILRASPGTRIDLVNGARIVSRSPLEWLGSAEAPVELVSNDGSGRGLVVLQAGAPSTLRHVRFEGLRVGADDPWSLTGAVTFYESPLVCERCEFADNQAEDALNVVRGAFRLDATTFRGAASDAFDGDFCEGEITNSAFLGQRNDGIDVSGSSVRIRDVRIDGAGDKGVSAGEHSDVDAEGLEIARARVALASKDTSRLVVRGVRLRGCTWAFAAFQKKPEFGPAWLDVEGLESDERPLEHLVGEGSRAVVDGRELPSASDDRIREILYEESEHAAAGR
jgi:hypothetical protein